jgi:EAL domain-containing protein (putative c-di-GMP-specific phosphodiesterase class I)
VLDARTIVSHYQPIVDIDSGAVVAYEALARGPVGTVFASPDVMFAEARRQGLLSDLDLACRVAALTGAQFAGLVAPWTLFVNTEPETAENTLMALTDDSAPDIEGLALRVIVELTERSLRSDPVELLRLVDRIRARGWGIALDDVGVDRGSLALLPLLHPDVIKLDLRLIQQQPTAQIAEIVGAVNAEAERAGSAVLAEGIETAEHVTVARSLGATLAQGWFYGRPGPMPQPLPSFAGEAVPVATRVSGDRLGTPFELAAATQRRPQTATKELLVELSKHLERQALGAGETAVIISTFQHVSMFTPATRRRYGRLVASAAFVGVLGEDIPAEPMPGVRGGRLLPGDPLLEEWDIVVIGPHYAAALIARDLDGGVNNPDRRFAFMLSHNRELVVAVAGYLMERITAV